MNRGEVWTAAGGGAYARKPRPVVVVQDDRFAETNSVTVCAFTTSMKDAPLFRIGVRPSAHNGLDAPSQLMVDKITTQPKIKFRRRLGRLGDEDMVRLNRAMLVFLSLAG